MLRWLVDKIMQWGWDYNRHLRKHPEVVTNTHSLDGASVVRLNIYKAMNGRVIEIHTPQSSSPHCDWNVEHMIIQDGDNLHDMVATLLLAKGMR